MFYQCFRLNYIMYLQKKYYTEFKKWNSKILILPPVFKRTGLNILLCFPIAKWFDDDNISRPIGVVTVNKQGAETLYNLQDYEFSFENQDFDFRYPYSLKSQEAIKVALDKIYSSLSLPNGKQKKEKVKEYENRLKDLLPDEYFAFYRDLKSNQILPISDYIKKIRKNSARRQDAKSDYGEKLRKEISKFIKKDLLSNLKNYPSFAKLQFYKNLGKYLKKSTYFYDFNREFETKKYDIIKMISIILSNNFSSTMQEDFISKVLLMTLNALLLKSKNKKLDEVESDLQNYKEIFEEEIDQVENEDKKIKLKEFFSDLENDKLGKNQSDIFFAYLYIFN